MFEEQGQAVVEYIIVLAFITLVVFSVLGDVGKGVWDIFIKAEEGFGDEYEYKCIAGVREDVYVYLEEVEEGYEIKRIEGELLGGMVEGMVFKPGSGGNHVITKDGLVLYILRTGEESCSIELPSPA